LLSPFVSSIQKEDAWMRSLRKLLVVTMIVTMVAGFAGMAAAATVAARPFTDAVGHEFERELTAMRALGIMLGDAGTTLVRPDAPITRAEMAVIISRAIGREALATALGAFQPAFADAVPTWAWGAVNVASNMGIIRGYLDGTFGATRNVTHAEALAMLIRATGHEPGVMGVWPLNFMMSGFDLGISGRVEAFANLPSSRGEVAHFVFNALAINRGTGVGERYNPTGAYPFLPRAGVTIPTITPPAPRVFVGPGGDLAAGPPAQLTIDGTPRNLAPSVHLWGFAGFPQLRGAQVRAIADAAGRIVFIEPNLAVTVVTGAFERWDTTVTPNRIVLGDGRSFPVATGTIYRLNEAPATTASFVKPDPVTITVEGGSAVLIEGNRVNIAGAGALVESRNIPGVAGWAATAPARITLSTAAYYNVPAATRITLNGAAATLADLRKDDVVYIATVGASVVDATNTLSIEAHRTTVVGAFVSQRFVWTTPLVGHQFMTLRLADGTTREVRWFDAALTAPIAAPTVGSTITYGLNRDGHARLQIAAVLATNIVRVTGVATIPGDTRLSVTYDMRGTSVTHVTYGAVVPPGVAPAHIGTIGQITVNAVTNEVDAFAPMYAVVPTAETATTWRGRVFSVDATGNVIVVQVYTEAAGLVQTYHVTRTDFVAYDQSAVSPFTAIGAFRPTANFTVGDRVYIANDAAGQIQAIFRKRDQTTWLP
jgi:hypothetical protein